MQIFQKRTLLLSVSAGVLFASLSISAEAAVVFDNGGPDTINGYYIDGANSTADNFMVASNAAIGSVGFYFQNYNGIAGWNQDITYEFLTDNGGLPDIVLASGAGQNLVAVDSGQPWCCGGGNAYLVTFDLVNPFLATAGTPYWLRLGGATGAPSAWWVTTQGSGSSLQGSTWGPEFAFFLNEDASASGVPEPSSLALFALGGAAIALRRRRANANPSN